MKLDKKICCGCSACVEICPKKAIMLIKDDSGDFLINIDEKKCDSCGLCKKVCSFIQNNIMNNEIKEIFALKKRKKRNESQSGGAFASFGEYYLKNNGVVYGVALLKDSALYARVDKLRDLKRLKMSKYVHADTNNVYSDIEKDLNNNKNVLASGTPCFIAGLLNYLLYKHVCVENLLTVDIICHGTVVSKIYSDYYSFLSEKRKIKNFQFRYKEGKNWGEHAEKINYLFKTVISKNYAKIMYSHLCLNKSCYICPFTSTKRVADITVGDCWGIENNDKRGTSLVLVNSQKGINTVKKIETEIIKQEYILDFKYQPRLREASNKGDSYNDFWNSYLKKGFKYTVSRYCSFDENDYVNIWKIRINNICDDIIVYLGKIKRILLKNIE